MSRSFTGKRFNKIEWPWSGPVKLGFHVQFLEQYICTLTDGYRLDICVT